MPYKFSGETIFEECAIAEMIRMAAIKFLEEYTLNGPDNGQFPKELEIHQIDIHSNHTISIRYYLNGYVKSIPLPGVVTYKNDRKVIDPKRDPYQLYGPVYYENHTATTWGGLFENKRYFKKSPFSKKLFVLL